MKTEPNSKHWKCAITQHRIKPCVKTDNLNPSPINENYVWKTAHQFIEKNMPPIQDSEQSGIPILMGYTHRWGIPPLQRLDERKTNRIPSTEGA